MPHVALAPLTGLRVGTREVEQLGLRLPGLQPRAGALQQLPALGLLTLAGLTPDHWTCSYHPLASADDQGLQHILDAAPDLVAISALTASIDEAYALSDRLRAASVPVVMGGLHVTACPQEAMRRCDAVVVGEGEASWTEVLHDAECGRLQAIYRGRQPRLALEWPLPRFDLLGSHEPVRYTLQSQRGCPLACDFCAASRMLGPFREKPSDHVRQELAVIARRTRRPRIELADDNTFVGKRPPAELFDALGEVDARYFTECDWRIGERPDVLEGLADSGCLQVLMGIESLVFRHPGMGEKQAELSRMLRAIDRVQETGVVVNACFIVGADGETRRSVDRLVDFVNRSQLAEVQITIQTPFPGTSLHRRLQREGRLLKDRGWSYYTLFDVTFEPDCMSVAELELAYRDVLTRVFSETQHRRRQQLRREIWRKRPRPGNHEELWP